MSNTPTWRATLPSSCLPVVAFYRLTNPAAPEWSEEGCIPLIHCKNRGQWLRQNDGMPLSQQISTDAPPDKVEITEWLDSPKGATGDQANKCKGCSRRCASPRVAQSTLELLMRLQAADTQPKRLSILQTALNQAKLAGRA